MEVSDTQSMSVCKGTVIFLKVLVIEGDSWLLETIKYGHLQEGHKGGSRDCRLISLMSDSGKIRMHVLESTWKDKKVIEFR